MSAATHERTGESLHADAVIATDAHLQETLGFASAHGEQSVRSTARQFLAEVEIVAEFLSFLFLSFHHLAGDDSIEAEVLAHGVACTFVFANLFGYDVERTLDGFFFRSHAFLAIDILHSLMTHVARVL